MSHTHSLVIGANRGIGFEITRLLSANVPANVPEHVAKDKARKVYASYRQNKGQLGELDVLSYGNVDVAKPSSLVALREALTRDLDGKALDELILVAGTYPRDNLGESFQEAAFLSAYQSNAMGPLFTVQSLLPLLRRGSKILFLTSRMGSIADNSSGGSYAYRMSKAALNMAGKNLAIDLEPRGIAVGIVHPGFVKTDMTAHNGHIGPDESAKGIVQRLEELNLQNTGTFWHQYGQVLPW